MIESIIQNIITVWHALESQPDDTEGFKHHLVEINPYFGLYGGCFFPTKKKSLLFGFPNAFQDYSATLPHGKGFTVTTTKSDQLDSKFDWITIVCNDPNAEGIFISMIRDLLRGILDRQKHSNGHQLLQFVIDRINAWQKFFGKQRQPKLSKEEEIGLWGELYVFQQLLKLGIPQTILCSSWVGPEDSPQDFIFLKMALEIKTLVNQPLTKLRINSLDQLDYTAFDSLYLLCNFLAVHPEEGLTLPALVRQIDGGLDTNSTKVYFENKLITTGYFKEYESYYDTPYLVQNQQIFLVDETFPSLTSQKIPKEIIRAIYFLDLTNIHTNLSIETVMGNLEVATL